MYSNKRVLREGIKFTIRHYLPILVVLLLCAVINLTGRLIPSKHKEFLIPYALISFYIAMGYTNFILIALRKEVLKLKHVFISLKTYFQTLIFITLLIAFIIIYVGFFFMFFHGIDKNLLVPAFGVALVFMFLIILPYIFAPLLILDKSLSWRQAIAESRRITSSKRTKLFFLFLLVALIGLIFRSIHAILGLLVAPFLNVITINAYINLAEESEQPPETASETENPDDFTPDSLIES